MMIDQEVSDYFWNSVKSKAMALPWCAKCARAFFYPKPICPDCWGEISEWKTVSGRGKVWSHSVVRFPLVRGPFEERLPYTVAFVALEEGPRVLSNIVECAPEQVKGGMDVQITYAERDGKWLYLFKPA
jgi:uncharacterized OB-fold protein